MFQLTKEEYENLRFQFETTSNMSRSLPYVLTEQGVAMLAAILRTKVAEEISIKIMDAFVVMKHYIENNEYRISNIETKIIEHDENIKLLQKSFQKFEEKRKINEILKGANSPPLKMKQAVILLKCLHKNGYVKQM